MAGALSWKKWDILLFCKLFPRFPSRCPLSVVELRGQVHPQSFDLTKNREQFMKIRVQTFRYVCLLLSYLTFFSEKRNIFGPVQVWVKLSLKIPVVIFRQVFNGLKMSKD